MKSLFVRLPLLAAFAICSLLPVTGCQNNTQTGAALGAGVGSLAGAIIGHQSGHKEAGALIGGLAGGLTGAAVGNNQDVKNERDAAVTRAANMQANQRAAYRAVSNNDLVTMTQNGVSDEIIINAIHTRGGRFRTNSEALISLQNYGVSPAVIMEAQRYSVD